MLPTSAGISLPGQCQAGHPESPKNTTLSGHRKPIDRAISDRQGAGVLSYARRPAEAPRGLSSCHDAQVSGMWRHHSGHTSRRHDYRITSQLQLKAFDKPVDQSGPPERVPERMLSTVVLPMALGGATSCTRGS